jgi:hypothetical protein
MFNKKEYIKKYQREHKEEIKKQRKERYLRNRIFILKKAKEYRETHREQIKEYHIKNKEKFLENTRKWCRKNRNKINLYVLNKRKLDLNFKLTDCLRHRIYKSLKGINKSQSTLKLLGCSLEFLKQHLESKFTKGMTWKNYDYNGWHVDHIIPCASFDLSNSEEQRKCFHYTNLQPLWKIDNIRKQDK